MNILAHSDRTQSATSTDTFFLMLRTPCILYMNMYRHVHTLEAHAGHFVNWGQSARRRLLLCGFSLHARECANERNGKEERRRLGACSVRDESSHSQKRSPRRSAVVVTASSVVPRAPLPSEAAAESSGHVKSSGHEGRIESSAEPGRLHT